MADPVVFPERPRVALACGATLGEGPVWDQRTGTLIFVDIKGQHLWRWSPGEDADRIDVGEPVGFALLTPDPDRLILGLKSGLARIDVRDGTTELVLPVQPDSVGTRLNDGCPAPDGSVYFGTMDDGERSTTGSFFRWSASGLHEFGARAVVTNGPAIDGPRRLLYCSDTTRRDVYRHRLGSDGQPGPREPFVTFEEGWGHPDGMALDEEGCVWIAHWGGSRVTRFSPDGEVLMEVPVPTAQVTKVAFGGPDLTTMYITTASIGRDREIDPMAGHVFAVETGIAGQRAELCRMGVE
jgi:sugar lactone lactonase YvrE